jgi:hypothetical protein
MKNIKRGRFSQATKKRWQLVALIALAVIACAVPFYRAGAAAPSSGTINPVVDMQVTWTGTATGGVASEAEASCDEGVNCDTYTLNVSGVPADWTGKSIRVRINWVSPSNDYDLYVHKDSNNGPVVDDSADGPTNVEEVVLNPSQTGTGVYTVHVVYFAVPVAAADQYQGSARVFVPPPTVTPAPAQQASGLAPRYLNHIPQKSIRDTGKGLDAAEPTLGNNWNTGRTMFQSFLTTFRVTFNDSCPSSPSSLWEDKSPATSANSLDPILWTDSGNAGQTGSGRTIVSQLSGTTSLSSYTDNDGDTWVPNQGGSGTSGVDHQGIGGGPFHAPLPGGATFQHAVYYCSQSVAAANCALSVDGGQTYGPAVPIYNVNQCAGLHGHPKVGPDGTVYVPNSNCESDGILSYTKQGVIVSEDNGITWNIRTVPGSVAGDSDPSVEIGKGGRVYIGMSNGNSKPVVAVSDDQGRNWTNLFDVGASFGINSVAFPAVIAGDNDRAAFAFFGSTTGGSPDDLEHFFGLWHLYIATTYDGGATWHTVNATPNDPIQRGALWLAGGSPPHRNLLDFFDATVDKEGRVLVGFADGCVQGCVQAPNTGKGNSYSQVSSIVRQAGGRGLFAAYDNVLLTQQSIPGAPFVTARRNGTVTRLTWSQANDGGTPVTNYKVYRRTYVSNETLLATLPGTATEYTDATADPNVLYLYRVSATNVVGESCGNNEVVAVPAGNSCTGYRIINDQPSDQTGAPANRDLDIQNISISEPYMNGANKLVFKLKVASLCQMLPNRQWRLIWNYPVPPDPSTTSEDVSAFAGRYYVGMVTDGSGTPSFDYGIVTNVDASPASTQTPSRLGSADAGSNFNPDGTITIVISNNKVGNPGAGDVIGSLLGRTFAGQGDVTVRSTAAADSSSVALADTYLLVGNAACQNFVPPAATIPKPIIADFDADTLSDVAVFRPNEGNWYFSNSFGSQGVRQWGLASDKITPGDFDGDRKTDIAVFRAGEGNWYIIQSSANTVRVQGWGQGGDKPVAADYDGDGYTDIAVWRPNEGNWYILGTSTCSSTVQGWGNSTDQPVPADYDGDGKADIAVFRASEGTWYVVKSTGGATVQGWGVGSDIPVPGDYDGDGKADLAVFRPLEGNWYILKSSGGSTVTNWGDANDLPVPADYDGDGKTDIAVFRGSEGNWYILKSSGGTTIRFLGQSGDIPVPLAYRPY